MLIILRVIFLQRNNYRPIVTKCDNTGRNDFSNTVQPIIFTMLIPFVIIKDIFKKPQYFSIGPFILVGNKFNEDSLKKSTNKKD